MHRATHLATQSITHLLSFELKLYTYDNTLNERIHLIPENFCIKHMTNHNHYLLTIEYTIEWYTATINNNHVIK